MELCSNDHAALCFDDECRDGCPVCRFMIAITDAIEAADVRGDHAEAGRLQKLLTEATA